MTKNCRRCISLRWSLTRMIQGVASGHDRIPTNSFRRMKATCRRIRMQTKAVDWVTMLNSQLCIVYTQWTCESFTWRDKCMGTSRWWPPWSVQVETVKQCQVVNNNWSINWPTRPSRVCEFNLFAHHIWIYLEWYIYILFVNILSLHRPLAILFVNLLERFLLHILFVYSVDIVHECCSHNRLLQLIAEALHKRIPRENWADSLTRRCCKAHKRHVGDRVPSCSPS